uniref:Uncharacterized protein n=1 Tax=Noccaea caerulescens TaxID=107243 RepID=A0A1J3HTI0_NOCCA
MCSKLLHLGYQMEKKCKFISQTREIEAAFASLRVSERNLTSSSLIYGLCARFCVLVSPGIKSFSHGLSFRRIFPRPFLCFYHSNPVVESSLDHKEFHSAADDSRSNRDLQIPIQKSRLLHPPFYLIFPHKIDGFE